MAEANAAWQLGCCLLVLLPQVDSKGRTALHYNCAGGSSQAWTVGVALCLSFHGFMETSLSDSSGCVSRSDDLLYEGCMCAMVKIPTRHWRI